MRLQVALAHLGFCSRRGAKEIIQAGRVRVNETVALKPGQRVDLTKDHISVDGRTSSMPQKVYFVLNKPKGVVTTVKDSHANVCVLDLIGRKRQRIYPVGRLDKDTTGLLILTNDGALTQRLTHPKFGVKKVYRICVKGSVDKKEITRLAGGVVLEDKKTFPCKIKVLANQTHSTNLELELTEGRKRQLKKMFMLIGHPVLAIERIAFGPLKLAGLKPGQWRALAPKEIMQLKRQVGIID